MLTVALAWTAVLASVVAAALFGQTARGGAPRRRRRSVARTRAGLAVAMSGPWLVLVLGVAAGAVTGAWLAAAAGTVAGVVAVATAGLVLVPR
ncbi:hypothetical protein [Trujillonella endophytica]|uniref:Uncharacterized protein n=1 Tax=Trujillonella endophytica TaxID=673521 RepID=A0A1H8WJP1_9ACTN|nr:hypothetical protein [Trujillella endophytica]SEP27856.1 hypothetical protein SAMN05660991_04471 [Trujillella endophytica]